MRERRRLLAMFLGLILATTAMVHIAGAQDGAGDGGWTLEGCDWIGSDDGPNETDQCLARGDFPSFNINPDWSISDFSITDDDEEEPGDADVVFQRIDLGENLTIDEEGDTVTVQGDGVSLDVFNDANPACAFTWDETSTQEAVWIDLTDDAEVTQVGNDTGSAGADVWNRLVVETDQRVIVIQGAVTWEEADNALRVTGDTTCQVFAADDELGQALADGNVHGTILIDANTNRVTRVNLDPNLTISGVQVEQTNDQFSLTVQAQCDCPADHRQVLLVSVNEQLADDGTNATLDGEALNESDELGTFLAGDDDGVLVQQDKDRTRVLMAASGLDQQASFQIDGTLADDQDGTDDGLIDGDDNETDENETDGGTIGDDNETDDDTPDDENDTDEDNVTDNDTLDDDPLNDTGEEAPAPTGVAVLAAVVAAAVIAVVRRD